MTQDDDTDPKPPGMDPPKDSSKAKAPKASGGGKSKGMSMPKLAKPSKITAKGHSGKATKPQTIFKPQTPVRSKRHK